MKLRPVSTPAPTLILLLLCLVCAPALATPPRLEAGKPVEGMLAGGGRQEHRVAVQAGWYVRIEIEQTGVDVAASLLGPDGAELFSTDDPDGLQDKEILAVISPATGELTLAVTPHDPAAPTGAYRVTLTARRSAGPGDAERAAAQRAQAEAWRLSESGDERKRQESILSYEEAARLWGLTGNTREQIYMLNELGGVQLSLFDGPAALDSFQRALALSLESGNLEGQALAHNNLATAFLGDPQRLDHYEQSLALWKKLDNIGEQGRVLYGMGLIHRDRGELDVALHYLTEALPLRHAAGDLQGESNTLAALAIVHQGRGEKDQALRCLDDAVRLSREVGGAGEVSMLSTVAQFHRLRGEFGEAQARLQEARELYRQKGNKGLEARALQHLGLLYLELGDLEGARRSYEEGFKLVEGKSSEGEARFLSSLGWTLYLQGDSDAALRYFDRALSTSRQISFSAGIAQALGQIGAVYVDLGRAREGLNLLEEELAVRRRNSDRAGEAKSLLETGRAWQALGDLEQAAGAFRDALDLGRKTGNMGLQAACLYRWAVLDRQRGDLRQALSRVEDALQIIESGRSRVSSEKLRITYLASKRAWYELYIDLQMRLEEKELGSGHAAAALEASERARARVLLDLIAEGRIDVREGIAPELKRRETELADRLSWIQERLGEVLTREAESSRAADLNTQLDRVGKEMEQLQEEIQRQHPRYAQVRYPTPLRLEQIKSLLDEKTALLEYFIGEESSFLFAVTRQGLSVHRLPPAGELKKKVQEFRATLKRPGILTLGRFRLEASDLYTVLLEPAAARLAGLSKLLISPDGPLSLIPFEALLTDRASGSSYKDLSYLLREHAISYVPSASVLDGLREPRPAPLADAPAPRDLVAFGDPIYPSAQSASVRGPATPWTAPALPGSRREVDAIARLYPESKVILYVRETANEENVKENPSLRTARRIHFATHGFVDEVRPQLSGLMLTRDPGSGEDGLLQVYEIFNLRLSAELVTLSACETALGEQVTGEGIFGLTRAFLYAGSRSLLVSLWPVSDLSTPDLMTAFYRNMGEGGTKAEALTQAKLERVAAGDEPYRWAPFVLAGDPF